MKKFLFFATALCAVVHISHIRSSEYEILMHYRIKPTDHPMKDYETADKPITEITSTIELKGYAR